MKTELLIIRHGQSMGNVNHIFCGYTDVPLSETGKIQAEQTGEFLKNTKIDAVYSSDLQRAFYTGEAIARRQGLKVTKNEAFREINAGQWENMHRDVIEAKYPEMWHTWRTDLGRVQCPDGESTFDVQTRFYNEALRIAKEHIGQRICITTHAMALRSFCARLLALKIDEFDKLAWPSNASITYVELVKGKLVLKEYSNDEHLTDVTRVF